MMAHSVKVTISLPQSWLPEIERERARRKQSRSAFFRHAIDRMLSERRRGEEIERYIEGYRRTPETSAEVEEAQRLGASVLGQEPWS